MKNNLITMAVAFMMTMSPVCLAVTFEEREGIMNEVGNNISELLVLTKLRNGILKSELLDKNPADEEKLEALRKQIRMLVDRNIELLEKLGQG